MRAAPLRVEVDPVNHVGRVAGWRAREYVVAAGGRPRWSHISRVWMTSEKIAADVVAMAEFDGRAVTFISGGDGQ